MKLFNNSTPDDKLARLAEQLQEFMNTTNAALELQNARIKSLSDICVFLTGQATEAQDKKFEALKLTCDLLMENDRVLQEAVKSNARDSIETMAAVEEIAAVLTGKNQPPQA